MRTNIRVIFYVFFFLISSCKASGGSDFNSFCDFVTSIEKNEPFTIENITGSYEKLYNHIENSAYDSELKRTFSSLAVVDPSERYNKFVQISEVVTQKQWSCKSLEHFYDTLAKIP